MTFRIRETSRAPEKEEHEDKRDLIQRMFYDHDPISGELVPLDIQPLEGTVDIKQYHDCIPLITNYQGDNPDYKGDLKGKTVLVIGGRRRGRGGTGVELIISVDDIPSFCSLLSQVGEVAGEFHSKAEENNQQAA